LNTDASGNGHVASPVGSYAATTLYAGAAPTPVAGVIQINVRLPLQAEPLLLEGYPGMTARKERMGAPDGYHLNRALEWIVQLYQAWASRRKLMSGERNRISEVATV